MLIPHTVLASRAGRRYVRFGDRISGRDRAEVRLFQAHVAPAIVAARVFALARLHPLNDRQGHPPARRAFLVNAKERALPASERM
jgi:hypothetical protein